MAQQNNKTYDYFKNDPIIIHGKFARYADAMWTQGKINENSKFDRLLDLYAVAAIIGLRIESRLPDDKDSDDKRTIQLEQIAKEHSRFHTIMQLILLIDTSRKLPANEKARMAFDTNPKSEDVYAENMELFHSYARGGLEYLYNRLVLRPTDPDDTYTNARVSNIFEFIREPINRGL